MGEKKSEQQQNCYFKENLASRISLSYWGEEEVRGEEDNDGGWCRTTTMGEVD